MARLAVLIIKVYQATLSRILPNACRFTPTCSSYAVEALQKHGFLRGGMMTAKRVLRCNPFCRGGYDPVP